MAILHYLNVADYAFMALGFGIALLMIVMGGAEERRSADRLSGPQPPARPNRSRGGGPRPRP